VFMTLFAAFQILLSRCCGQKDLVVGSLHANRSKAEFEPLIGCFSHRFVIRTDLSGDPEFRELLALVRDTCLETYAHLHLPLWKISEMALGQHWSELTKVYFALQSVPVEMADLWGLRVSFLEETGVTTARLFGVEQMWQVWEYGTEFRLLTAYRPDLFSRSTVERMVNDYRTILARAVVDPNERLSRTHANISTY
jgi:non-ribosomal peptide synthetase component F